MALSIKIPAQRFELIRDRIATIIASELENQKNFDNDLILNAVVWLERFVPFDISELPAISIAFETMKLDQRNPEKSIYDAIYTLECYCSGSSDDQKRGDVYSSLDSQKLAGKIRYILENPNFLRLGFDSNPSFVVGTEVDEILITKPQENDGNFITLCQLRHKVKLEEDNGKVNPIPAQQYVSQILIENTTKGIKLIINNV